MIDFKKPSILADVPTTISDRTSPLVCQHGGLKRKCDLCECAEDIAMLEKENKRLREALEFYAEDDNYNYGPDFNLPSDEALEGTIIDFDNGEIARKALGKV